MSLDNSPLNIVRTHIRIGNKSKARELIKEHLQQYPQDTDGWYLAAQLATSKTQAIACLEKAIKIDPFHEKSISALSNLQSTSDSKQQQIGFVPQKQIISNFKLPKVSRKIKRLSVVASVLLVPFMFAVCLVLLDPSLYPSTFNSARSNEIALASTEAIATVTLIPATQFLTEVPTLTFTPSPTIVPSLTPTNTPRPTKTPRPQPTSLPRGGKWTVEEDKSSFDDSNTVTIYVSAENSITAWLDTPTPILFVFCREKKIQASIYVGTQADIELDDKYNNRPTARFRFDNATAFKLRMSESTDGEHLFFGDPGSIINQIQVHNKLLFGFTPFNASFTETQFDIRGLSDIIQPLINACQQ